ncbi:MAG TPA: HAD family hydrolase [Acidimicrobiales bacterium]|nr:HAD family hydrolase [Acidimicrobiales bacterium]
MIRVVLFDLGDTLIFEQVDDEQTLDEMVLHLRPDAASVLGDLAGEYKLGLVTDTERSNEKAVRRALRKLDIEQYFDAVVTSVDVGSRKPRPEMFSVALAALNATADEAVMVGNDPHTDISGAIDLGLTTILFRPTSYYSEHAAAAAHFVVDRLSAVPDIVRGLDG